jgi:hypothetical protein
MFTARQIEDAKEAGRQWFNVNGMGSLPDEMVAGLIRAVLEAIEDARPRVAHEL